MQQQDRERSLACYGLHTCGEAVTRRVPPKAAGSPDHAISSVHRENTSESCYEGAADKQAISLSCGGGGGALQSLPGPAGCFSTPVAYGNLYIIYVFRHYELHFTCPVFTYRSTSPVKSTTSKSPHRVLHPCLDITSA